MPRLVAVPFLLPAVLAILVPTRDAVALTTACVNTPALLQGALAAAQTNLDDNYIKVVASSYGFGAPVAVSVPAGHALTIEGGYTAGCASAPMSTVYSTVIVGGSGVSLRISVNDGALTLRNFTLTGFQPPAGTSPIALFQNGPGGTLHVENVRVNGNTVAGINDDVLYVASLGGLVFDDNLIDDNPNAQSAVHIAGTFPSQSFAVANNTVVNNLGPGLYFDVGSYLPSGMYNNILWHNGVDDLVLGPLNLATPPLALNNLWGNCNGCESVAAGSAGNSSADPVLTSNYHLANGSPAVNAGVPLPLLLPALDAGNAARVVGSAPDLGAFESSADDFSTHTYVVYNSGDDAANIATLRGAITDANSKGVPARINLHYSTGCPTEVDLATPLPAITVPMLIDGYADPNSAANTAPKGGGAIPFNATLCTILFNTGAASNNAFSVAASAPASQHLEVRGVRLSHFNTAVSLAGGNGHWIHGNAFSLAGTLGNNIGVGIFGGQADVVGGPAPADVNLIGASSGAAGTGVLIDGPGGFHTVANNNIGGNPLGDTSSTAYANAQNGVELVNATRDTVSGNMIEFSGVNGVLVNAASYSVVAGNLIALGGDVSGTLTGNVPGVRVSNGSFDNWIGTTAAFGNFSETPGNEIVGNSGPGVWIDPSAGVNNQVTGGFIGLNLGLAIDLGAEGPTPNSGTESSGPNFLLHKPVLSSAVNAGANTVQVNGSIPMEAPGIGRLVTLYANQECGGSAETMLGTFAVQSGPDSIAHFSLVASLPASSPYFIYINATEAGPSIGPTLTSEISNTRLIQPNDDIFYDTFDCY